MEIAVIGFGRMGKAIALGLSRANIDKESIIVYDMLPEVLEEASKLGFKTSESASSAARQADVVIVAVKPGDVEKALKSFADEVSGKVVVSIAALIKLKVLESIVPKSMVYRAMPNIAVEINKGFTALTPAERKNDVVEKVFRALGEVMWVNEKVLDMLTFFSASTPAIVAELYDAFLLSALKAGVPYHVARKAIATVFQGVGALTALKEVSSIRDSVITPGGVTIRIIEKFYTYGAKQKLIEVLRDAYEEYEHMLNN
uniref:Pyrroline-5-carboxylate reductase n=1 Tax=Ignisphaera aggregans TaxID=334771 RepID=A0A7J2U462_9CREN